MNTELRWLSISDYGRLKGKSDSTIRRYIKMDLVRYKMEDGKYFIQTSVQSKELAENDEEKIDDRSNERIIELTKKLNHYKSLAKNQRIQNLDYLR